MVIAKSRILGIVALIAFFAIPKAQAMDVEFLLDVPSYKNAVGGFFAQVYARSVSYVDDQTKLEMERFLQKYTQETKTKLTTSDLSPLQDQGCLKKEQVQTLLNSTANYTGGGGSLATNFQSTGYYRTTCQKLRNLNMRFAQTLISMEYKNMFMDGDTDNSSFDILADIAALRVRIDGKNPDILPVWNRTVSPEVRYLEGEWSTPVYEVLATDVKEVMRKNMVFKEQPLLLGNQCLLGDASGNTATRSSTFSEAEKDAVLEKIVQVEQEKNTEDPAFNNDILLTKDSSGGFEKSLTQAQQFLDTLVDNGSRGCASFGSASACFSFTLVGGRTTHASILQTPATTLPSLFDSLQHLKESTGTLSAQNLQLKNEPRSVFSFGWQDLRFVLPKEPIKVEFVPMVPLIDVKDYTSPQVFKDFGALWDVVNASEKTPLTNANLEQALEQEKKRDITLKERLLELQQGKITYDAVTDMEKTIGAQLDFFFGELTRWTQHVQKLHEDAAAFARKPLIKP